MKYYLIAGEASGDLHASHLMQALREQDPQAQFRFIGGDLMTTIGGRESLVQHYSTLAYMGFIPVLLHARTILNGMKHCRHDILAWQPDVLILVDYPGFNLKIAKYVNANSDIPVYYYIAPKIWAWKEYRIRDIRRDVQQLFSILPFEVEFFQDKHHYPIHYVGNPTVDEVSQYLDTHPADPEAFRRHNGLDSRPIIALLAGSRRQEIQDNLSRMTRAAMPYARDYQLVIAGAPGIEEEYYRQWTHGLPVTVIHQQTYPLLQHSHAALVTSGTATLETALFRVPQVVCYYMWAGRIVSFLRRLILNVRFISLVNLIADREVVPELVADEMTVANVRIHLGRLLPTDSPFRQQMLQGYEHMAQRLGAPGAPQHAARIIIPLIKGIL